MNETPRERYKYSIAFGKRYSGSPLVHWRRNYSVESAQSFKTRELAESVAADHVREFHPDAVIYDRFANITSDTDNQAVVAVTTIEVGGE